MARKVFYALGTDIRLEAYGGDVERAMNEAESRLMDIDDRMSVFKSSSEVSRINSNAGGTAQSISKDTFNVISEAVHYAELSGGAFDPTIRPLVDLFRIGREENDMPDKEIIEKTRMLVNYRDIELDNGNSSVRLKKKNQAIDLGGIAKGYAADEAKCIFKRHGIQSAMLDLGGNICTIGGKPDGKPWRIGIQNPFTRRGECFGAIEAIEANDMTVVTSGNYERYSVLKGKKYHHIIDRSTGSPSENGIVSTTIICERSIDADALSTCVYVLGLQKGMKLIESMAGYDAVVVTYNGKVYATPEIKQKIKMFYN